MSATEDFGHPYEWVVDPRIASLIRRKACQLARQRRFGQSDRSDIEQELYLALVQRADRYDPSRGQPLTYAAQIIESKAASLARKAGAQKRGDSPISLNQVIASNEDRPVILADLLEESEGWRHTGQRRDDETDARQLRLDVREANRPLAKPLRKLAAVLSFVRPFSAAKVLGISRRQVALGIAKLRSHYEEYGLHQ
jgi:RNA polymerase sigma factor (sigma-70 family)